MINNYTEKFNESKSAEADPPVPGVEASNESEIRPDCGCETQRSSPPTFLPLAVDLTGLTVVVVGGGRIGTRKARTLLGHGARLTVVSPELSPALGMLAAAGRLRWLEQTYDRTHLQGAALVVAATSSAELNCRIGGDAERMGILHCVASSGKHSRVIFPARHARDGVVAAVHSNGRDCRHSRRLRDRLAAFLARDGSAGAAELAMIGRTGPSCEGHMSPPRKAPAVPAGVEALVLDTCWRWECYLLAARPREVLHGLRESMLSASTAPAAAEKMTSRIGIRAYHHLLRVLTGLDSPLSGETDIVGQMRSALDAACSRTSDPDDPLTRALREQRSIRRQAALVQAPQRWADVIALRAAEAAGADGRTLIVGCGKLGLELHERLAAMGLPVQAFSCRAGAGPDDDLPPGTLPTAVLPEHLPHAAVLVVLSALADAPADRARVEAACGRLTILDARGGQAVLARDVPEGRYLGPADLPPPPDGEQAARLARAEELCVRHAVEWAARTGRSHRGPDTVRLVGRPSEMSRRQVRRVTELLSLLDPHVEIVVDLLDTPGDRDGHTALYDAAEDFFTRDLDQALLSGRADLAVHSVKDLPGKLPDGLVVAAVLPTTTSWECLVSAGGRTLADLPCGARVGTSSERRRRWLADRRPDLLARAVRGNVPRRIEKMDAGEYDALLLAAAGLIRLGLEDRITEMYPPKVFEPEPGQGALAVLARREDVALRRFCEPLDLDEREALS